MTTHGLSDSMWEYVRERRREDIAVRSVTAFPRLTPLGADHDDFLPFRRVKSREDDKCGLTTGVTREEQIRMDIVLAVQLALHPVDIPHPFMEMLETSLCVILPAHEF